MSCRAALLLRRLAARGAAWPASRRPGCPGILRGWPLDPAPEPGIRGATCPGADQAFGPLARVASIRGFAEPPTLAPNQGTRYFPYSYQVWQPVRPVPGARPVNAGSGMPAPSPGPNGNGPPPCGSGPGRRRGEAGQRGIPVGGWLHSGGWPAADLGACLAKGWCWCSSCASWACSSCTSAKVWRSQLHRPGARPVPSSSHRK